MFLSTITMGLMLFLPFNQRPRRDPILFSHILCRMPLVTVGFHDRLLKLRRIGPSDSIDRKARMTLLAKKPLRRIPAKTMLSRLRTLAFHTLSHDRKKK